MWRYSQAETEWDHTKHKEQHLQEMVKNKIMVFVWTFSPTTQEKHCHQTVFLSLVCFLLHVISFSLFRHRLRKCTKFVYTPMRLSIFKIHWTWVVLSKAGSGGFRNDIPRVCQSLLEKNKCIWWNYCYIYIRSQKSSPITL